MSIKPFAIQGADLTLGGVNLQAGTTGVVIPGVTQATNYKVEEVNDTNEQTHAFTPNNAVVVIDYVVYTRLSASQSVGGYADFEAAATDEEGYIDGIEVNGRGAYTSQEASDNANNDMYAYNGTDPDRTPFVPEDWIQIPFRPKMRAGDVESIGGGGSILPPNTTFTDLYEDGGATIYNNVGPIELYSNVGEGNDAVRVRVKGTGGDNTWTFKSNGHLELPNGGDIVDSTGTSVLGGTSGTGDANVWVETFDTSTPITDLPAIASSVEYDAEGNIIALFAMSNTSDNSSYTAVGKYTSAGTKIWTVRFSSDAFNTDGWGLAVDNNDGSMYVAGKIGGNTAPHYKSILTKLSGTDGSITWSQTYDFGVQITSSVVDVASDGNPVVVGYAEDTDLNADHITTTKIDKTDGSVIWARQINGQEDEEAYGMAVGSSGEIVVVGYISELGQGSTNAAATAVAVPSSNPNWTTQYNNGTGLSLNFTGNFVVDIIVTDGVPAITVHTDRVGNRTVGETLITLSGAAFGGVDGVDDMVINVASVSSAPGSQDDQMVVVKYDSTGSVQWQKAVLFDTGFNCNGADADIDSLGNVYVVGQYQMPGGGGTISAMSIVKFDSNGAKQWSRRVIGDCDTWGTSIVVGPDDRLYVSGMTINPATNDFIWVVAKYKEDGLVDWQRLVDNTASWTFNGGFWFNQGGGSNIAVKDGYVALSGGFGNLANNEQPHATLVQVSANGNTFSTGTWDFTTANFSGTLNSSASDIIVDDAQLTDSNNSSNITVATISPGFESSNFLIGTLYGAGSPLNRLVFGDYEVALNSDGTISFPSRTVVDATGNNLTGPTLAFSQNNATSIITQKEFDINNRGYYPIRIQGQRGYGTWSTGGAGGYGGGIEIYAGLGGETSDNLATGGVGGEGGYVEIKAGNGQAGKKGGYINLTAGDATFNIGSPNSVRGGDVNIQAGNATDNIETNKGVGGDINITAGSGNTVGQAGRIQLITDSGNWQFTQSGEFRNSNSFTKTLETNLQGQAVTQVVWTSTENWISGVKLLIQVESEEIGDTTGWHSQVCEAVIASRGYANSFGGPGGEPQMTVYGVTHTSVAPLITFTVQRNVTTKNIEVVATRTAAVDLATNVNLRVYSVETGTRD